MRSPISRNMLQSGHKFVFDAGLLMEGTNKMILSLPANATGYKSAVLLQSVYNIARCTLTRSEIGKWVKLVSFHIQKNGYGVSAQKFTISAQKLYIRKRNWCFLDITAFTALQNQGICKRTAKVSFFSLPNSKAQASVAPSYICDTEGSG